jgi:hypothetical protein
MTAAPISIKQVKSEHASSRLVNGCSATWFRLEGLSPLVKARPQLGAAHHAIAEIR